MNFFEILIENENELLFQKRNRNWKIVWTTAMLLFIPYGFLIYYFNEFLRGFPILRAIITTTIFVVAITFYFLSTRAAPDGYSHLKQAICHLGRIRSKKSGSLNLKTAKNFAICMFLLSTNAYFLGSELIKLSSGSLFWTVVTVLCYFSGTTCTLTGISPIDLFEKLHTNTGILTVATGTTWMLMIFYTSWAFGTAFLWMQILAVIISITAGIYLTFYVFNVRYAGFLQKLWMFFINLRIFLFYLTF